jgi:hypothetical protein
MALFKRETTIERMVRNCGWVVTHREDDVYRIRRGDGSRMFYLNIRYREDYLNVLIHGRLGIQFPLSTITPEMTMGLLVRNTRLVWCSWGIQLGGSCDAVPSLASSLQTEGLTDETFAAVCRAMATELEAVYDDLHGVVERLGGGGGAGVYGQGHVRSQAPPGRGRLQGGGGGVRFLE